MAADAVAETASVSAATLGDVDISFLWRKWLLRLVFAEMHNDKKAPQGMEQQLRLLLRPRQTQLEQC